MLDLYRPRQIADHIGFSVEKLNQVCEDLKSSRRRSKYCEEMVCFDPGNLKAKQRPVLVIKGVFKAIQKRIYTRLLLERYEPSDLSHGGIAGRSIKSNTKRHACSKHGLTVDITNFYPSISHQRVYRLYHDTFNCHADPARLLTRLTTHNGHLALGLVTSPLLADAILKNMDDRLGTLCEKRDAVYSRYVDDITVTADYPIGPKDSGLYAKLEEALRRDGFDLKAAKTKHGRLDQGLEITGLRFSKSGQINVRSAYMKELNRRLADAQSLGTGASFVGPYYTREQLLGQILFVRWIHPRSAQPLWQTYRKIQWSHVEAVAASRGYVRCKKTLRPVRYCQGFQPAWLTDPNGT